MIVPYCGERGEKRKTNKKKEKKRKKKERKKIPNKKSKGPPPCIGIEMRSREGLKEVGNEKTRE